MGSRKRSTTVTRKGALDKVREHFDSLTTLEANVLRMRYGLTEEPDSPVGAPPASSPKDTIKLAEDIEEQVLEHIRGSKSVKRKIVDVLRSKS